MKLTKEEIRKEQAEFNVIYEDTRWEYKGNFYIIEDLRLLAGNPDKTKPKWFVSYFSDDGFENFIREKEDFFNKFTEVD